jgi:hypothetical protein
MSAILIASASLHYSVTPQVSVQITKMEIHFLNENATSIIDFDVGFLTHLYILVFGGRNLDPYLEELFYDFEEYRITSVRGTTATVELINVSRSEGALYLHEKRMLGIEVGLLILLFPDGHTMTFNNTTETQNVFY